MPWHTVQTHLVGAYNIANIRAAITVGLYFGVDEADINQAIADYQPTNSRSEFRETDHNKLIVDAYNANPSSMNAALTNFAMMNVPQKMVILGDMRELGANSEQEHRSIIERLVKDGVELAWLVGEEFCKVVKENPQPSAESTDGVQIRTFAHVDEVKAELQTHPISGRTILIKGSNGTKLFQLPELL